MDKMTAQNIANKFARKLPNFANEAVYIGLINNGYVFYIPRTVHGGFLGRPPYYSVSDDGNIELLTDTDILLKAISIRTGLTAFK